MKNEVFSEQKRILPFHESFFVMKNEVFPLSKKEFFFQGVLFCNEKLTISSEKTPSFLFSHPLFLR